MYRYRQRRLSASESSRELLDVRNTSGVAAAGIVPSSGMATWYSASTSSSSASASTSRRSTSSMSRTTGSGARMAASSGRDSRNSSLKMSDSSSDQVAASA